MKVLITGHEGFIGSYLYDRLKQKYTVIGIDIKSGLDIRICDLPDCDLVIHLAALGGVRESIKNPEAYWSTNVDGTRRILGFYHDKRVLVAGSSSQYEPHLNPYAASKHIIEKIPHPNVCFMRFHTVYSETPRSNMFFDKLLKDELSYVTDHERDFIHIEDLCDAIEIIIISNIVGSLDIGSGTAIKVRDFRPDLPVVADTPHERQKTLADISLLKTFGFSPKHSIFDFYNNIRR